MPIELVIKAETASELQGILKGLCNSEHAPEVKKLPPDPRLLGSNILKASDKLRHHANSFKIIKR
jgi:hypothetical protein